MTDAGLGRASAFVAIVAALLLTAVGFVRGTWAVGGSDSSCYALMADAVARGELQPTSAWARDAPWPSAPTTLAPGGFLPSPVRRDAASPVCAPGFSLLLAPVRWALGPDGIFVVTPVAAGLLVWLTAVFAGRIGGPVAGAAAAVLVAASPIVLFQAVQPMNDVTTAMLWMAVLVACARDAPLRPGLIGALTGLALLVRPNLAPAAGLVGLWIVWQSPSIRKAGTVASAASFALGALPFAAVVAGLNAALYGGPLRSGYGNLSDLFGLANVPVNAANYARALFETQTPFPLLALLTPLVADPARRSVCWLAIGVMGAIAVVYLPYRSHPEWWYLRFQLPVIATGLALASAGVARLLARSGGARLSAIVTLAAALAIGIFCIRTAIVRHAFALQALENRFRLAADVVRDRLPPNTVAITVWDSGSIAYHAGRHVVLWDALDPAWLDASIDWLRQRGHAPVIVVERWEEPVFRTRFARASRTGALDWPPRFDIDRQVRIFDPGDRGPYFGGAFVPTEIVR